MADISKEDLRKEIAAILKDADLASTSAKKVRQELEEKLSVKLQSRKKEIDDLVMEFVSSKKDNDKKKGKKNDSEDDAAEDEEEEEEEEEEEAESDGDKKKKRGSTGKKPAAKKAKKESEEESGSEQSEGDSEEEYSPKKTAKPAKTRKLPPKKKKGSESDSDEDWGKKKGGKKGGGGGGGGGGKKGSGYTKPLQLSPELAALVGADSMARHEVVKKMWAIIKEKNLYDPKNKQYAICDDALFKVIGTKRFRTFGMMKYLKSHFIS